MKLITLSSPHGIGTHYPPGTWMYDRQCITNQGGSPELHCPEFLLGFHSVGMIGWIINPKVEFNLQQPSLAWRLGWYHVAQSPNPPTT